ncbi:MAG: 30S ribosomal protein S12 methylthiotransferase RimO [Candidatus Delongbacteria bacterium]|nr:30S ribosomal protein S12 methylthiotransferase RimO [Candidatus Delongbacteria bacterium]
MKRIKIVTLGCDKNLVDSEVIGGRLSDKYEISPDFESGEAVIINTCGFIGDAKKQSIEAIFEAVRQKQDGKFKKVLLTGCLIERYFNELKKDIPEVDGFFRLGAVDEIAKFLEVENNDLKNQFCNRVALESEYTGYIKISDGCDHKCSYCAIPGIRGKYRSRTIESIIEEVQVLISGNVKEIILVGQEISSYGADIYKKKMITDLLKELSVLCGKDRWIRLLYTHPPMVDRKFIETIAEFENVCNYIDFPVQHTETAILKVMGRGNTTDSIISKVKLMRQIIPDIAVRTSIIAGFPGETRKIFNSMKKNLGLIKFDRLGVFPYSREEDTRAFDMNDQISRRTAEKRAAEIMEMQREISFDKNNKLIGNIEKVLIDRIEGEYSVGRTFRDAPDVDNEVLIKKKLVPGEFYKVRIVKADEFDLYGEYLTDITFPS